MVKERAVGARVLSRLPSRVDGAVVTGVQGEAVRPLVADALEDVYLADGVLTKVVTPAAER